MVDDVSQTVVRRGYLQCADRLRQAELIELAREAFKSRAGPEDLCEKGFIFAPAYFVVKHTVLLIAQVDAADAVMAPDTVSAEEQVVGALD